MRIDEARAVLGVGAHTRIEAVRRRYHELARELHPDAGGSDHGFQRLQHAYATLLREQPPGAASSPSWGQFAAEDGEAARAAAADRLRRTEAVAPQVDLDTVDWTRPLPDRPVRLDLELLAVVTASSVPVATVTARSRGPRALLNRAAAHLEDSLVAELVCGARLREGHGVRLTARKGRLRRHLAERSLPEGWIVRQANSDLFVAEARVEHGPYARVNGLRHAVVADRALASLSWPLSAWTVTAPLAD